MIVAGLTAAAVLLAFVVGVVVGTVYAVSAFTEKSFWYELRDFWKFARDRKRARK